MKFKTLITFSSFYSNILEDKNVNIKRNYNIFFKLFPKANCNNTSYYYFFFLHSFIRDWTKLVFSIHLNAIATTDVISSNFFQICHFPNPFYISNSILLFIFLILLWFVNQFFLISNVWGSVIKDFTRLIPFLFISFEFLSINFRYFFIFLR